MDLAKRDEVDIVVMVVIVRIKRSKNHCLKIQMKLRVI